MSKIIKEFDLQLKLENLYNSLTFNNGNAKNIINKYIKEIGNRSDYMILKDVCTEMKQYDWLSSVDNFIRDSINFVYENEISFGVYNTLESLKNSRYKSSYIDVIYELEHMINMDEGDIRKDINRNLNKFKWVPEVKLLIEMNNNINNSIVTTDAKFSIYNPISPIYENESGDVYFYLNNKIYTSDKNGNLQILNENKTPEEFLKLCNLSNKFKSTSEGLRFIENGCIIDLNVNENDGSLKIFIDKQLVNENQINSKLISTGKFKYGHDKLVSILEHTINKIDNFYSLGFVDTIESNIYENVKVNLIKTFDKIYINKINPYMNENVLIKPSTTSEAIRIVKEFINYDITPRVKDLLEGDQRVEYQRSEQERKIHQKIKLIKDKISEISEMNMDSMPQIKEAKKLLQESLDEEVYKLNQLLTSKSRVINEDRTLMRGGNRGAIDRDIEQSDIEYIITRQKRDEIAIKMFGKKFRQLDNKQKRLVNMNL